MGLELLGVVASFATIFSGLGWVLDKNHKKIEEMLRNNGQNLTGLTYKIEKIETSFNDLRAEIPAKFVTKSELLTHMRNEEKWQSETHDQLIQIREEISALRQWTRR
jgi:iron-sulfur cluster repair protein YtfE (RIC family)